MSVEIRCLRPAEYAKHLLAVAQLRIEVFRAFPYLYDGDISYEQRYLETYANSKDSLWVLALDGETVVGASTALPLADEGAEFQQPFIERRIDPAQVFYFGESVLLRNYRGRGIGHRFFDAREAHARSLARFVWTAFAAVDRDASDPRRPQAHRDNDAFWLKRGYSRQPGMQFRLAWKEIGETEEREKPLTFWLRPLDAS